MAIHINSCLYREYDDTENYNGDCPTEESNKNKFSDTYELLFDEIGLHLPNDYDGRLSQELLKLLDEHEWQEIPGQGSNALDFAGLNWHFFCDAVMHHRRYFSQEYFAEADYYRTYSPGVVLGRIFEYAREVGSRYCRRDPVCLGHDQRAQKPGLQLPKN